MDRTKKVYVPVRYRVPLKRSAQVQYATVADNLGIANKLSKTIVKDYLDLCREDLFSGHIVMFLGLVTLFPDVVVTDQIKTTAYYAKQVGKRLGVPYFTCLSAITSYLDELKLGLFRKERAILGKLVILIPFEDDNEEVLVVRARSSSTLLRDINAGEGIITKVSARVSKFLRKEVKYSRENNFENDLTITFESQ